MSPSSPPSEDRLQKLIANYPDLIGDGDGQPLLIRREQPISDSSDGNGRWSLDHLFVTHDAVPVLVEVKRAADTRLLDYAANGVAHWQPGAIAQTFAATCESNGKTADEELRAFLGEGNPEQFWEQVDANFRAGRIKLVFVADTISPELGRIVEFLNEQMRADVRAIELSWFEGDGGVTTLVPRVVGKTQRAAIQKPGRAALDPISIDEWIVRNIGPKGEAALKGAQAYVEWIQDLGGRPDMPKTQGSIAAQFIGEDGRPVYPIHLWEQGGMVSLSFRYLLRRPGLAEEVVRRRHYEAFKDVLGGLSTSSLTGSPGFSVERLSDASLLAALTSVAQAFVDAARRA
jgi:hypothetical protein